MCSPPRALPDAPLVPVGRNFSSPFVGSQDDGKESKLLLEPAEETARRPELLGEDADARPVAQHVVLTEQVDHVEPRLYLADRRQLEPLRDAEVELLVGRIGGVVRVAAGPPQPA